MSKNKNPNLELKKSSFQSDRVARKFLSNTAQTLIQWMPLGGSGSFFISFAIEQKWLMAFLMFPVMCVTVVWARYTDGFLTRLGDVYQKRGQEDVDSLMAWFKKIDRAIRWQLAGTEDKYLHCQGGASREYRTEGYHRETFIPLLNEVFVPLELSSDFIKGFSGEELPMLPGFYGEDPESMRAAAQKELKIWDLLARVKRFPAFSRMAILAWGGYGKTTLLQHVTYTYAARIHHAYNVPKFLPVLLYLRRWQKEIANNSNLDLPSLIEKYHIPSLPEGKELKLPPNWARRQLKKGKMLVMFDGFDEVKDKWRERVSAWLDKQMKEYQKSAFILTSRPSAYKNYSGANPPSSKLYVKPFNKVQRRRFIRKWYLTQESYARAGRNTPEVQHIARENAKSLLAQLQKRPDLEVLAKNPLLLNMIANLHRSYGSQQLPQRRAELYQDICILQLKDRPRERGIDMLLPFPQSQEILQKVALALVTQNQVDIRWQELETSIDQHLSSSGFPEVLAPAFLNKVVEASELIVKRDENYQFAHLSFQAYLAAVEIDRLKKEELLRQHWQDSWWRETILLYCARTNSIDLINHLIQVGSKEATALAYDCLKESPRKLSLEADLKQEKLESSFSKLLYKSLQKYLKNADWQEADKETARIMLQITGKEENQWIEVEDIENFPCQELHAIDHLWRKYSNGRFGFSVQASIYKEQGGTREYNRKIWEAFADRIGWRKEGEWFFDLTYDITALPAHLPYEWVSSVGIGSVVSTWSLSVRRWFAISSLAQRLAVCKIAS